MDNIAVEYIFLMIAFALGFLFILSFLPAKYFFDTKEKHDTQTGKSHREKDTFLSF